MLCNTKIDPLGTMIIHPVVVNFNQDQSCESSDWLTLQVLQSCNDWSKIRDWLQQLKSQSWLFTFLLQYVVRTFLNARLKLLLKLQPIPVVRIFFFHNSQFTNQCSVCSVNIKMFLIKEGFDNNYF